MIFLEIILASIVVGAAILNKAIEVFQLPCPPFSTNKVGLAKDRVGRLEAESYLQKIRDSKIVAIGRILIFNCLITPS